MLTNAEFESEIARFERAHDIAVAQALVAENIAVPLCLLAGIASYLYWSLWWLSLLMVVVSYVMTTRPYHRRADLARNAFAKAESARSDRFD